MGQWTDRIRTNNGVRYVANIASLPFKEGNPESAITYIAVLGGTCDRPELKEFWLGKTLNEWNTLDEPVFQSNFGEVLHQSEQTSEDSTPPGDE